MWLLRENPGPKILCARAESVHDPVIEVAAGLICHFLEEWGGVTKPWLEAAETLIEPHLLQINGWDDAYDV